MSQPQLCHVKSEASFKHKLHQVNSVSKNKNHLSHLWQKNTDVSATFHAAVVASANQKLLYNTDTADWEVLLMMLLHV